MNSVILHCFMLAFTLQRYTGALASACRRSLSSKAVALPTLSTTGVLHSPSFRMDYFSNEKDQVSPWHDIPLYSADQKGTVNFLCEIPRCTTAKMEVDTKSRFNPIVQDVKNGEPRFYHGPIYWNYGCLPQTWEDPNVKDDIVGCFGDNDPLDVVEIGTEECEMGGIYSVKPLCVLSMYVFHHDFYFVFCMKFRT